MEYIMDVNENDTCQIITNRTGIIFTNAYNGIPETLILNVIFWLLLLVMFSVLRHNAWDYGRLALFNSRASNKSWTQIFYAHASDTRSDSDGGTSPSTPLSSGSDQGIFSWIIITLKLDKEQILMHTGPDAVHYLSFQQHLMGAMAIITAVCILVILPINIFNVTEENALYDANSFARTTMANIDPNSLWLWVHVFVSISFVPLVVLIMRRSSGRNAFKKAATRTIMIKNISSNDRNKTVIRNYIQELFPDVTIEDVQLAYNISKLCLKDEEYKKILSARVYCENHRDRDILQVKPKFCSCEAVNALEYYQQHERRLAGDVARLRASALNEPLGIAFVSVSTVFEAQNIINHFSPGTYRQWHLTYAPSPDDLFWDNLNISSSFWYLKWAIVNIVLFLVLFFLTTPAIVVNYLNTVYLSKGANAINPLIYDFLPTIMLWTLSALMPVIVSASDKWLPHYTRSLQNYSIMTKCFGYLLFMILILPSLGLTSAQALLEWSLSDQKYRWECIFLPDRGSFYTNYVITAAFIGTALELIRFPELIVYVWKLTTSKSKAETPYIRKSILIKFPFGVHYAWTVLVFTISVVYSVFCPLIMPFAMVYICLKHFVDRHNLYFSYGPSNMISQNGGKIHSTAVTMTKFSVVILLLILAMISVVRGQGTARAIVLMLALILTLVLFTFMSPIKHCTRAKRPSITEISEPMPVYVADVLKFQLSETTTNDGLSTSVPSSDYGSSAYATHGRLSNHSVDV